MYTAFNEIFGSEYSVLCLIAIIAAIANGVVSAEWLTLYKHFKTDGLFSWQPRKTSSKILLTSSGLNFLFQYPNVLGLFVLKLIASFLIPFLIHDRIGLSICCIIIAILTILISIRSDSRFSGADQMTKLVFLTLGLCLLSPNILVWKCGLIFISIQLVIAYTTPGWLRILEPSWHNNVALTNILRLKTFSRQIAWNFASSHPKATKTLAILLIMFECCFLVAWLLPIKFLLIFLCLGVLFHLSNALIMGLNNFLFSFTATYPAYIWVAIQLRPLVF